MGEFDLIDCLKSLVRGRDSAVLLGMGDDAALIDPRAIEPNQQLVMATDTLVADRHFNSTDKPEDIGHKALAVNLSDMAAMAAEPKWMLLNLTLPNTDEVWLTGFIRGMADLLSEYPVELIGGDTTAGPLSISMTVIGLSSQPKKRSDAQADDLVVISGVLGSAAFALDNPGQNTDCDTQLKRPMPRFDVATAVQDFAGAMIDVSDGLLADLNHICQASDLGACVDLQNIPVHEVVKAHPRWRDYVLSGGDDYQLCFTIRPRDKAKLPADCRVIGHMQSGTGLTVVEDGKQLDVKASGFDHFRDKQNE